MMERAFDEMALPSPADRRNVQRRLSLKRGLIIYRDGYCTLPCQVSNFSELGARAVVGDSILCPKEFTLRIAGEPPRRGRIAWRSATAIGIQYL